MSSRATNRHNKWHSRAFVSPQVKYMFPSMSPSRQCDTCPLMLQGKIYNRSISKLRFSSSDTCIWCILIMKIRDASVHYYTFQAVCHFPHNLCLWYFFSIKIEFQIVNVNVDIYINMYLGTLHVQHLGY